MTPQGGPGPLVRASVGLYRIMLRRYPAELRRSFGADMVRVFEAMLIEGWNQRGLRGFLGAWGSALRDWTRPLPRPVAGRGAPRHGHHDEEGRTMGVGLRGIREDAAGAWRSLSREPRFTGVVVGVLAMGLALHTTVLSVVNAYLLRPLPYPGAERIVQVRNAPAVSWTEVEHLFDRAVSWDLDVFTMVGAAGAESVRGSWITPDFMEMYAVRPALGRGFRPEEAEPGAAPVAVISHRLWRDRFGGDPAIVGRSFDAFTSDRPDHAESFRIVGVLPEDYWYVNDFTDVFAPIREDRQVYTARLRPEVSAEQATAALTELAAARMDAVPEGYRAELVRLQDAYVDGVRSTLGVLQAAVALVLLIACANAVVLLFVRCARREREFGVRRALGAGRTRLGRQLVLEGAMMAGAAAALGLMGATVLVEVFGGAVQTRLGTGAPGGVEALGLDATVVGLTLAVAGAIGAVFGGVPYLVARRAGAGSVLGARAGGDTRRRARFRNVMVAGEVALSMALLAGAGLMVRSALNLQRVDLGFDPAHVTVGEVGLRVSSYPEADHRVAAFTSIVDRTRAMPGVASATVVARAPFGSFVNTTPLEVGDAGGAPLGRGEFTFNTIGDGYFDALGIEWVAGRGFDARDARGAAGVAIVSESAARRFWPAGGAIGGLVRSVPQQTGSTAEPGEWWTVVGVVADAEYDTRVEDDGQVYLPLSQSARTWMDLVVRARPGVDAAVIAEGVRQVLADVDPEIPFADVQTVSAMVDATLAPPRFTAGALVVFAGFAAMLAVLGLYGVVAYAARQRRRDVAIRMAVGADASDVTGLFVRQGLAVVAAGVVVGAVGGLALGRSLAGQLHEVAPTDPAVHGIVALGLLVTAAAAVWIPARGAARTDPMGVLREE